MNEYSQTQNFPCGGELPPVEIEYDSNPCKGSQNPSPLTITRPLAESEVVLNNLNANGVAIPDYEEIRSFLDSNPKIATELWGTAMFIPRLIEKPFSLKLKLEKDPEVKDFRTLLLAIVGRFTSEEAFNILERVDKNWAINNIYDTAMFNVNIEFL